MKINKKLIFMLAVLIGLAGIASGIVAALCSTTITIGMILPVAAGLALTFWALRRMRHPGPVIRHKGIRRVLFACVCAAVLAVIVLEALMLSALLVPRPEDAPDCVLVLGCGIFPDGRLTLSLQSRLDTAYDALLVYPDALCIVSGGQGDNEPIPEAQAMRDYLLARGVEEQRILMEPHSRNTAQNMRYSADIMHRHGLITAVVVTNDYHIYRALVTAERCGVEAFGIGAPTNWRIWLAVRIREYAAIVKEAVLHNEA